MVAAESAWIEALIRGDCSTENVKCCSSSGFARIAVAYSFFSDRSKITNRRKTQKNFQ